MPPFIGEVHVRNNDWNFYLRDTLWEPLENQIGDWRMMIELEGRVIAQKSLVCSWSTAMVNCSFGKKELLKEPS
jgi:hypothetical protein